MSESTQEFGIVGLGRMSGNLAKQALGKRIRVVAYDRRSPPHDPVEQGLVAVESLEGFRAHLSRPRAGFPYIPAGPPVDALIGELRPQLDPGELIADGGNSYWGDSIRRHARLTSQGIQFVDLGTSGGVEGALRGACFMAGGDKEAVARIEPILTALAVDGGFVHAGPAGAGHFTKLVHNDIEFGMLQAIAEGVDLLEHYPVELNVAAVLRCWRHGSVIRSWLIDLMEEAYRAENGLEKIPPFVEDTGEVNWLVDDALHLEVPVPVMAQAVMQLLASRDAGKRGARAIAMMRLGFGGHPYGPDAGIARERREGRVGGFFRQGSGQA